MITWLCCIGQGAENAAGNAGDALEGEKKPRMGAGLFAGGDHPEHQKNAAGKSCGVLC